MKFFVSFLSILALIVVDKVNATFLSADCSLDSNECKCGFDFAQNYSIMICQSILEPDQNRLPSLPCHILRVVNGFDRWPVIPFDGKSKEGLLLSENQIDTIGDLTNLDNLEYLNISHNRITKINSSMSSLQKLALLDLSFNLLEQFHFEDLVPYTFKNSFDYSQPISGTLEYLFLNRNQIKQIINFDLALVGMPLCNVIALDDNMLTSLDVFVLSQQSQNVIEKIKQALTTNDSYLDIFEYRKMEGNYYGFNLNLITRFNVNFKVILNDVFARYKSIFLKRFLSISLVSERDVEIACDCNTYLGLSFILEQLVEVYAKKRIPDGDLQSFGCFQKNSNKSSKLFNLINKNRVNRMDFCDKNTTEYQINVNSAENDVLNGASAMYQRDIRNLLPLLNIIILFL